MYIKDMYAWFKKIVGFIKSKTEHRFAKLTPDLAAKEIVFKAPPLTKEIVKAIKLISPQYVLQPDEKSRIFWEQEQNGCCWGEEKVMREFLLTMPKVKKCLEIGPGLGRSVVFLNKKNNWPESEFHLYESEGDQTKYINLGPRFKDSFCGTLEVLNEILEYNGVKNYKFFDAKNFDFNLSNLPGPYDIIYSLYAVGFHWSLEHFIDEIITLMHERTLAFFIVDDNFVIFDKLKKINFKIIDYTACYPANKVNKMLIMSKSEL